MPVRVLIAGAGVAALEAALALQALAGARVEVELLGTEHYFWYRPLSVAQPFDLGEGTRYQLPALALAAGAIFTPGTLEGVEAGLRVARTSVGSLQYDFLIVAVGATPVAAVPGALTFRGPADTEIIRALLEEIAAGGVRRVAFVTPADVAWSLPLYELALLTASHVAANRIEGVELTVVTPEPAPLGLYGRRFSLEVRQALEQRRVALWTGSAPLEFRDSVLRLEPAGELEADRVVALPRLRGARLDGVPQTADGFVPVDSYARVEGLERVYAAGDIVDFPVKHGGIAAQLADVAAASIAARAGAPVRPEPFRPLLEGVLLAGAELSFLPPGRAGSSLGAGAARSQPSWEPPPKIASRYLAPFLARFPTD
jgi:sulfide:quinone oxidoreductase